MLSQKIQTARSKGLRWCVLCTSWKLALSAAQKLLRFDPWHATNHAECRPYKRFVAKLVSDQKPRTVVEVGCGLGDIVSLIEAKQKIGIDPDKGAITLARLLHPRSPFIVGDLTALDQVTGPIDVVLAIGWVHVVSPEYLSSALAPHLDRISYIILDHWAGRWGDGVGYTHDFAFLGPPIRTALPPDDPVREYLLFSPPTTRANASL
jgi:SAM-dependent methyltransferase